MRNTGTFMLFGLAVMAGGLAQASTSITTCGYQITAPGDYQVTSNLTNCSSSYGIDIEVSQVTIHLNGHAISTAVGHGGAGFLINLNSPATLTGIQIIGPGVVEGWQEGIDTFNPISNVLVQGVTFAFNTDRGINLRTSSQVTISQNVIARNGGAGMFVDNAGTGVTIQSNQFFANGQAGLYLHSGSIGSTVSLNMFAGNGADGIVVDNSSKNVIQFNSSLVNGSSGFHVSSGSTANTIRANTSNFNGYSAYDMQDDNTACGTNVWSLNLFSAGNQSCIK